MVAPTIARVRRELHGLPRQFWLLAGGTFVFLVGIDMCFPFETLYLNGHMGISMSTIGLIIGVMSFVGVPFQIPTGLLTDRIGRRPMIVVGILATMTLYLGIILAPSLWLIVVVFGIEAAFGWSAFLTASNAMTADLVPIERRAEAYSITRTAVNAGAALGPLLAAGLLATGGSLRLSFFIGCGICALFAVIVVTMFKETRPRTGRSTAPESSHDAEPAALADGQAPAAVAPTVRSGYAVVLRDTRFLLLLFLALLPTYCFAQIWVTLPVMLRDLFDVSSQSWGLLLTVYSATAAVVQYPLVRVLRQRDPAALIGVGTLVMAVAITAAVHAPRTWLLAPLMVLLAFGVVLYMPLMPAVVSRMAPVELRGRYMGVWTLVYLGGYGLGPLLGARAMDALGARGASLVVLGVGVAGMLGLVAFAALRPSAGAGSDGSQVTGS